VKRIATPPDAKPRSQRLSQSVDEMIERRREFLAQYQDAAYAKRYTDLVERVRAAESAKVPGSTALGTAVARYFFKLMAYKDEYEVARLYTDGDFLKRVGEQFEGGYKLKFHLAPPLLAKTDPATGEPRKREYGAWMLAAFRVLAKLKFLRGGALDVFGYSEERRTERRLIADYERVIAEILDKLDATNLGMGVHIASIPEHIRGYGPVKERHLKEAKAREAEYLLQFRNPGALQDRAATIPIRVAA
jgi:indolepyruvate ferredoxin oxidoreductase